MVAKFLKSISGSGQKKKSDAAIEEAMGGGKKPAVKPAVAGKKPSPAKKPR